MAAKRLPRRNVRERRWVSLGIIGLALLVARPSEANTTVRYAFDDANRMVRVDVGTARAARYSYDASGRVIRTERDLDASNGVAQTLTTHHRYDVGDRLVAIAHVLASGERRLVVAGQAIHRLAGGLIYRLETFRSGTYDVDHGTFSAAPDVVRAYKYDGVARLTRETTTRAGETQHDVEYQFDVIGNRLQKTVSSPSGVETTNYTYDRADRLTLESVNLAGGGSRATTYAWDGNGNLASKTEPGKVTLYRFSPTNRLIDIRVGTTAAQAQSATPAVTYAYDAQGNRIRKLAGMATSYLIDPSYDHAQLAMETKGDEQVHYVRGLDLLWQTRFGGMTLQHTFPLQGHLGTSLGAVDSAGNVVESLDLDAYGNFESGANASQTHVYTGEYWDQDAQLLYLRARWYDPKIGRFISGDPFEQERRRQPDTHGHHTIPVYLCGAVVQPKYANITPGQHAMIHAQIAGIALTIKAAEEYAYKTLGRIRMWEVLKIAQTDQGRGAIAGALEGLYRAGWWGTGAPNTIGDAFTVSKPGYVSGTQTSLPWCSRSGSP